MTPEAQETLTVLFSDILSQAPVVVAVLFLIYRMETREQTAISVMLEIIRRCFDEKTRNDREE